jgi:Ca2+-binding RTX toxin-like protein
VKPTLRIVPWLTTCVIGSLAIVAPAWGVVTSTVAGGALTIIGDEDDDDIRVRCGVDKNVLVNDEAPGTGPAPCADLTSIAVTSNAGDDDIDLHRVVLPDFSALSAVSIDAGTDNDSIRGSGIPDAITAGDGRDDIRSDPVLGDNVDGGDETDQLITRIESDVTITPDALTTAAGTFAFAGIEYIFMIGGENPQTIDGRAFPGPMYVDGRGGNDRILGGSGTNSLGGSRGDDRIVGGPAGDALYAGKGKDVVIGKGGGDTLEVASGDDHVRGGPGNDRFCCVYQSDAGLLDGARGVDSVSGWIDAGTALLSDSRVTIQGYRARLRSIEAASITAPDAGSGVVIDASRFSGRTSLQGGAVGGDDILIGGTGPDALFGLDGNDELRGGGGRDALDGGPGADSCDGGPGDDRITHCE